MKTFKLVVKHIATVIIILSICVYCTYGMWRIGNFVNSLESSKPQPIPMDWWFGLLSTLGAVVGVCVLWGIGYGVLSFYKYLFRTVSTKVDTVTYDLEQHLKDKAESKEKQKAQDGALSLFKLQNKEGGLSL